MNAFLKILGLLLVIIGAIILIACFFTGNVNDNLLLGGAALFIIVGIITYIVLNKRLS